jgi:hypothetical protein
MKNGWETEPAASKGREGSKLRNLRSLDRIGDQEIEGLGLTVSEVQAVARRQLAGSIVAGILIVAVAAVFGLRSVQHLSPNYTTAHSGVHQPEFVHPTDHVIAAGNRKIEPP